eukprot:325475_1
MRSSSYPICIFDKNPSIPMHPCTHGPRGGESISGRLVLSSSSSSSPPSSSCSSPPSSSLPSPFLLSFSLSLLLLVSARSHCVFTLYMNQYQSDGAVTTSKINLINESIRQVSWAREWSF